MPAWGAPAPATAPGKFGIDATLADIRRDEPNLGAQLDALYKELVSGGARLRASVCAHRLDSQLRLAEPAGAHAAYARLCSSVQALEAAVASARRTAQATGSTVRAVARADAQLGALAEALDLRFRAAAYHEGGGRGGGAPERGALLCAIVATQAAEADDLFCALAQLEAALLRKEARRTAAERAAADRGRLASLHAVAAAGAGGSLPWLAANGGGAGGVSRGSGEAPPPALSPTDSAESLRIREEAEEIAARAARLPKPELIKQVMLAQYAALMGIAGGPVAQLAKDADALRREAARALGEPLAAPRAAASLLSAGVGGVGGGHIAAADAAASSRTAAFALDFAAAGPQPWLVAPGAHART